MINPIDDVYPANMRENANGHLKVQQQPKDQKFPATTDSGLHPLMN
jgi:hypothetical protein